MSITAEDRDAKWQQFLTRHHLLDLWTMGHDTEQTRYAQIVQDLEHQEKVREELEKKVVMEQRQWAVMSRHLSSVRRQRCQEGLNSLSATADKVQLAWAKRVNQEAAFERVVKVCAKPGRSAFRSYMIQVGDFGDNTAKDVPVYITLHRSRYYFGSPGGRYILRHKPAELSRFDEASRWTAAWNSLLDTNQDDLPQRYTFCGLVPRTLKEYMARFQIVCPKVVQLLGSIVSFNGNASDELATFPDKATSISPRQLIDLHNEWKKMVLSDNDKLGWAQGKTRTHTLVLECAYLFGRIANYANGFIEQMKPLADTLQLATGLHGGQLIDIYDEALAHEAINALLQRRRTEQCLLIGSEIKEVCS